MSDGNKFWLQDGVPFASIRYVHHREPGTILGILKAQDVFVVRDGYLVIDNPCKPHRNPYG